MLKKSLIHVITVIIQPSRSPLNITMTTSVRDQIVVPQSFLASRRRVAASQNPPPLVHHLCVHKTLTSDRSFLLHSHIPNRRISLLFQGFLTEERPAGAIFLRERPARNLLLLGFIGRRGGFSLFDCAHWDRAHISRFGFPVVNAGGAHCRLMADRRRLSAVVLGFFELGWEGFDVREVC